MSNETPSARERFFPESELAHLRECLAKVKERFPGATCCLSAHCFDFEDQYHLEIDNTGRAHLWKHAYASQVCKYVVIVNVNARPLRGIGPDSRSAASMIYSNMELPPSDTPQFLESFDV